MANTKMQIGFYQQLVQLLVLCAGLSHLVAPIKCYYNETRFKELVLHDHTNDDAVKMSTVRSTAQLSASTTVTVSFRV